MIPFTMIVVDELCDGPPEVMLADRNDSIQALLFDRPHHRAVHPEKRDEILRELREFFS